MNPPLLSLPVNVAHLLFIIVDEFHVRGLNFIVFEQNNLTPRTAYLGKTSLEDYTFCQFTILYSYRGVVDRSTDPFFLKISTKL